MGNDDTPIETPTLEPRPFDEEVEFILQTAAQYLDKPPSRKDVLSVYTGIRPLVKANDGESTAALSRDHTIRFEPSGFITITGGKWTTYRHMAEDCVNHAAMLGKLDERPCVTRTLNVHGFHQNAIKFGDLEMYGADAPAIEALMRAEPELAEPLDAELPYVAAQVVWAARHEMARTLDDVLSRRMRALILNAAAALRMAPRAAAILARELGRDDAWRDAQLKEFAIVAEGYQLK